MRRNHLIIACLLMSTSLSADNLKPIQIEVEKLCKDKIYGTSNTPSFLIRLGSSADERGAYADCLTVMEPYLRYESNDKLYAKHQFNDKKFRSQNQAKVTNTVFEYINPTLTSTGKYIQTNEGKKRVESELDTLPFYTTIGN